MFTRIKRHKQVKNLVHDFFRAGITAVDFINDDNRPQPLCQRLAEHKFRLWHWPLSSVGKQDHAIRHPKNTLYLTTKISMAWGVDDIDPYIAPHN